MEAIADVALVWLDEVYHVGHLDPALKGVSGVSLEGNCLSVSCAPEDWRKIAKLGGAPTHRLRRAGGCFVGMLELCRTPTHRAPALAWAESEGLVECVPRWKVWFRSEEGLCYFLFESELEARLELAEDEDARIEQVPVWCGTPALAARTGVCPSFLRQGVDATQFAVMAWVAGHLPEVDGIWWAEDYAPWKLSAPRGGVFPHKLVDWTISITGLG